MPALYDSPILFPGSDPEAARSHVVRKTRSLYSVRLAGPLHPMWGDHLTRGLASYGISVLNGFARRRPAGDWGVEFLVTPMPGAADPGSVDYVALCEQEPLLPPPPITLDAYAVDGSPEHAGLLYAEVRGPDRLGFLGSVLRLMADKGLVPREMWIATWDSQAYDRFLLAPPGGRVASDDARRALGRALKRQRAAGS